MTTLLMQYRYVRYHLERVTDRFGSTERKIYMYEYCMNTSVAAHLRCYIMRQVTAPLEAEIHNLRCAFRYLGMVLLYLVACNRVM